MQITLSFILYIFFLLFKSHGIAKFNKKIYTLVRVYKVKLNKNKKIIWFNKSRKNIYSFIIPYSRLKLKNKSNMPMLVENHLEGMPNYSENICKFDNICTFLNSSYWKNKNEVTPFIQIAPMIHVTNRHFRALIRSITKKAQLWTEMIVDNTLLYNLNNLEEYLGYNKNEHPIVCQLGGCNPITMSEAAILVEQAGYDEININLGCPSKKVANKGAFGAYLMKTPERVKKIVYEIKKKVQIPVTVKIRIGIDDCDSFEFLTSFIETLSSAGCNHFIVHARKAWLKGLDPKQNRSIPPLEYKKVFDLCKLYPNLKFTLNGGIKSIQEAIVLLNGYMLQANNSNENNYVLVDNYHINPLNGVMIGRACMDNPTVLSQTDKLVYNERIPDTAYSRRTILDAYKSYLEENSNNLAISSAFELLKPTLGLLKGIPGHRMFRNKIDTYIRTYSSMLPCSEILEKALIDVDRHAPGCLDLPLGNQELQEQYIKNY